MGRELVTKSGRFFCVSTQPDICKTPIGPGTPSIPYIIKGEFSQATGVSPDITSQQEPVVIHASTVIPTVTGDEKGTAKGVKSKTVGARVQHDEKSSTVSFNGQRAIRVGDSVFMNDKNTSGKVLERPSATSGNSAATKAVDGPAPRGTSTPYGSPPKGRDAPLKDQRSETSLAPLLSRSDFISQTLLNRVPGAAAAGKLLVKVSPMTALIGKQVSAGVPDPSGEAHKKARSAGVGIDGGSSRGNATSGNTAAGHRERATSPVSRYTAVEQKRINDGLDKFQELLSGKVELLERWNQKDRDEFFGVFGTDSEEARQLILKRTNRLIGLSQQTSAAESFFPGSAKDMGSSEAEFSETYAYVEPDDANFVVRSGPKMLDPANGDRALAGLFAHEFSHFKNETDCETGEGRTHCGTLDGFIDSATKKEAVDAAGNEIRIYGPDQSRALSPDQALFHAYSYQLFVLGRSAGRARP